MASGALRGVQRLPPDRAQRARRARRHVSRGGDRLLHRPGCDADQPGRHGAPVAGARDDACAAGAGGLGQSRPAAAAAAGDRRRDAASDQGGGVTPDAPHMRTGAGHIQRLLALAESRRGNLRRRIAHWRKAVELEPNDTKAAYALAQEMERQGGAEHDAEAQKVLEALIARQDNLVARLDLARLAAKRGDAATLQKALAPLTTAAASWPAEVQDRFKAVSAAASGANPRAAAPAIAFLKNVLLRVPEYRRSLAEVSTPREEVGEPFEGFVMLATPTPAAGAARPGAAVRDRAGRRRCRSRRVCRRLHRRRARGATGADRRRQQVRIGSKAVGAFPGGAGATLPTIHGVVAADLNYDYLTDLVLAGDGGLRILRQQDGRQVRRRHRGGQASVVDSNRSLNGASGWPTSTPKAISTSSCRPGTVRRPCFATTATAPLQRSSHLAASRTSAAFAWLDLDNDLVPDAVVLDGRRDAAGLPEPARRAVQGRARNHGHGHGTRFPFTEAAGRGPVRRRSRQQRRHRRRQHDADDDRDPAGSAVGHACRPKLTLPLRAGAAADLDGDGRLDLVGVDKSGAAVVAKNRGTKAYHYQIVRPKSATVLGDQRINSFGIGGEVEVRTGLHAQRVLITSPIVHIGLGEATRAEVARIFWPNGTIQSEFELSADTTVAASQRLKGSCPWLFAWNGREMAFVTDLIWRSPLGLAHQRAGDGRHPGDGRLGEGARRPACRARRRVRPAGHRGAMGDALLRSARAGLRGPSRWHRGVRGRALRRAGAAAGSGGDRSGARVRGPCIDDARARRRRRRRGARRSASRLRRPWRVSGHHARPLRRARVARGRAAATARCG